MKIFEHYKFPDNIVHTSTRCKLCQCLPVLRQQLEEGSNVRNLFNVNNKGSSTSGQVSIVSDKFVQSLLKGLNVIMAVMVSLLLTNFTNCSKVSLLLLKASSCKHVYRLASCKKKRCIQDPHKNLTWRALITIVQIFVIDVCGCPGYASRVYILWNRPGI